MMQVIEENWPLVALAAAVLLLLAWWIFAATRKTSVHIEDKPEEGAPAKRNQSLINAPPVAASTDAVTPVPEVPKQEVPAAVPVTKPSPSSETDDLSRIKGVGPKLVAQLHELGVTSFAQIAAWDEAEIARVDAQLGRFQGRIQRDSWVAQAKFLATGDEAGFEGQFGKI